MKKIKPKFKVQKDPLGVVIHIQTSKQYLYIIFRSVSACSITDATTNTVVITGGCVEAGWSWNLHDVTRYGTTGFMENLLSLNVGRCDHGCGAYTGDDGEQV